jgi:cyclic pyranopterin phosphate synthase
MFKKARASGLFCGRDIRNITKGGQYKPMSERSNPKVVPIVDLRQGALPVPSGERIAANGLLTDTLGRNLRDLRISVTDRCNFRCGYCMPKEIFDKDYAYLPHSSLLTFEEIVRVARQFVNHGVQKIRLTGGEPLLRKNIEILIEQLAKLRTVDGAPLDLTLTTNGALLARKAQALKDAGLRRVTVSLDALDDAVFRRMNDVGFPVGDVLEGIHAAHAAGLGPIKINMVVKRGTNDQEIVPMARHFKGSGMVLRFIEYMDVGATNGWRMNDVVPSAEVIQRLQSEFSLLALEPSSAGETAQRWGFTSATGVHDTHAGEVGVISSVTQAFCGDCNRARLSTEGQLYLCLFANKGYDLRSLIRGDSSEADIASAIGHIWNGRSDRYSELRGAMSADTGSGVRRVEMSYIGG